jgi:regulator of protease activity HflC (stomatin/prohibitin superfamily)
MNKQFQRLIVLIVLGLIFVTILSSSIFYTLNPGERGVVFKKFGEGLIKDEILEPGFHVIAPWNRVFIYDVKEKIVNEKMDVLDKNGLSINVDVSIRFNPFYRKIGYLHEIFGIDYVNTLIIPEVRSSVRKVMGRYTAEEIYSTKRKAVEDMIIQVTTEVLASEKNNIQMNALLIRSINLPPQIKEAIENKLKQEQEALAYQFRLDKEKSEAERKRIAAEGEAVANDIVNSSLSDKLLKMRGIEATLELSKSPNSKIVIVGSQKDGLPLILGNN